MRCGLPVCGLRVLFIVEWAATAHRRNDAEVVGFWRGIGIPLKRKRIPWIRACWLATAQRDNQVPEKHHYGGSNGKSANRRQKVQFIPAKITGIGINATWHTE